MRNYPKSTNNPGFLCASLSHDGSFLASFFAAQDLECVFVDVLGVKKSGISLAQLPSILKKKKLPKRTSCSCASGQFVDLHKVQMRKWTFLRNCTNGLFKCCFLGGLETALPGKTEFEVLLGGVVLAELLGTPSLSWVAACYRPPTALWAA